MNKPGWRGIPLAGLMLLGLLTACAGSPPAAETPEPAPAPVIEEAAPPAAPVEPSREVEKTDPDAEPPGAAATAALKSAGERAAEARRLARDFGAPDYFPPEWDAAEELYTRAEQGGAATLKEARETTEKYDRATAAFEDLAAKTLTRYAREREAAILKARRAALAAGAGAFAPDYLLDIDNRAAGVLALYEEKAYYEAREAAQDLLDRYEALEAGVLAYRHRLALEDAGFARYDPAALDRADAVGLAALAAYDAGDPAAARDSAAEAGSRYEALYEAGEARYAGEFGEAATEARRRALEIKADVAVREDFNMAETVFIQGVIFFNEKDYRSAADFYEDARLLFDEAAGAARVKRQEAEEALQAAERKQAESDDFARDAERRLGE